MKKKKLLTTLHRFWSKIRTREIILFIKAQKGNDSWEILNRTVGDYSVLRFPWRPCDPAKILLTLPPSEDKYWLAPLPWKKYWLVSYRHKKEWCFCMVHSFVLVKFKLLLPYSHTLFLRISLHWKVGTTISQDNFSCRLLTLGYWCISKFMGVLTFFVK